MSLALSRASLVFSHSVFPCSLRLVIPSRTLAHQPVTKVEDAESRKRELFAEEEEDLEEGQLHRIISQDADSVDQQR